MFLFYRVFGDSNYAPATAAACPAPDNALPTPAEPLLVAVKSRGHGQWGSGTRRGKQALFSRVLTHGRSLGFSKTTTLGNWSANILVHSRSSVHPEADKNVRAPAA